jgi:molecular chaperone DnaK (HSP70)
MSRDEMAGAASACLNQLKDAIRVVLAKAGGLTGVNLSAVEIVGGGVRIPAVQEAIVSVLEKV